MNANGIVMPIRCTMPFPGRTTSRAKYDITPLDAIAAPAAGRARSVQTRLGAQAGRDREEPRRRADMATDRGEIVRVVHP